MARRKIIREEEAMTPAAATLEPGAGSGGTMGPTGSRVSMMNDIMSSMSNMSNDDLTKLKQVLDQIGQEAANIPPDAAQKNLMSITPRGMATDAMREELSAIFDSGSETLTEEFVEKATTLFESAVGLRVNLLVAEQTELLEQQFNEAMDEYEEQIVESLDKYFDYFADEYLKENELVIEQSVRTQVLDSFLEGLHTLMKEHYIDIPEDKVDIVEELALKVEQLEAQNNELLESAIENKRLIQENTKVQIVENFSVGLTPIQASKLRTLTESIDFVDEQNFTKKVQTIVEHYFSGESLTKRRSTNNFLVEENSAVELNEVYEESVDTNVDPRMKKYSQAIARTVK